MAVYQDIARTLESEIRSRFHIGDLLPSEAELARRFSINRHTVRRAIDELALAGLVLKQQGRGTMVVDNKIEYGIRSRARFTEALAQQGRFTSSEVVQVKRYTASSTLASRMGLQEGSLIIQLDTLRSLDEHPLCIISHHLNARLVPDIDRHFHSGSLHQQIEALYGIRVVRRQCTIGAALPDQSEAGLLRCSRQLPLIVMRSRNTPCESQETVEYSISKSRSDCFEMTVSPDALENSYD